MITNDPENCVQEWIEGYVSTNKGLLQLPGHQVVLRADLPEIRGKVAVLSGGGAGHEPTHAGYVGRGMLTGSIIGSVFTSPPPKSVYAAIRAVNEFSPSGVLLIVTNYTGDRLNFGHAKEWAERDGIKVKMIIVADDCAAVADSKAGKRGLAGTIFVHKIAGAMAENGEDLESIFSKLQNVSSNIGTIGVCLKPCVLPGQESGTFTLGNGEMELGLGVHGEAGVKRMKFSSSKDLVKTMMDHVMTSDRGIKFDAKESVAILVNNLGGTSNMEMGVFTKDVLAFLSAQNMVVVRSYVGTYETSLQMHGVSISILRLSKIQFDVVKYLDMEATVSCPLVTVREQPSNVLPQSIKFKIDRSSQKARNILSPKDTKLFQSCIHASCKVLVENCQLLNNFDKESGDGDCGSTHKRGAAGILKIEGSNFTDGPHVFGMMSSICSEEMGGTSGAIYGILFAAMQSNMEDAFSISNFGKALIKAIETVKHYGQASRGDRTLIDVLEPVGELLSIDRGENILGKVIQTARENAEMTTTMRARVGRASYVDKSVIKHPDPGAYAASLVITACAEVLLGD